MNRWTRLVAVAGLIVGVGLPATAGELQKTLKSRWLGAWIVTTIESYSDCNGMYSNNRINGTLVKSGARRVFEEGELAKLDKVDAKRSRLDLHLSFREPVLLDYQEGPFTLYRESRCKIEVQLELPRSVVKSNDVAAVEAALSKIMERHTTEASAKGSLAWNERKRQDYPEDYEQTLFDHQVWEVEQTNGAVRTQLDAAYGITEELTHRMKSDANYVAAFTRGVEKAQNQDLTQCSKLLAVDLASFKRLAARKADEEPAIAMDERGYQDGRQLIYGLAMIKQLPQCFLPVPEIRTASND